MNKIIRIALSLLVIIVAAIVLYIGYTAFTITDPYIVKPAVVGPAKRDARVGYSFDKDSKSLSVVTSKDVILVADPGKSFKYVEMWILERPKSSSNTVLSEYIFNISEFAREDKIHFEAAETPIEIAKFAQNQEWN